MTRKAWEMTENQMCSKRWHPIPFSALSGFKDLRERLGVQLSPCFPWKGLPTGAQMVVRWKGSQRMLLFLGKVKKDRGES